MAETVILYTESDDQRICRSVKAYERRPKYTLPRKKRRRLASGGCACQEIHRFTTNGPTAGTFSVTYTVSATDYTLTWDWNATVAEVQAEFDTESAALGTVTVYGTAWPSVAFYVVWDDPPDDVKGIQNHPSVDNSSLTNGDGFFDKFSTA